MIVRWLYKLVDAISLTRTCESKMEVLEMISDNTTDFNDTALADFEVFDSRDLMNVLAYAAMSISKLFFPLFSNYFCFFSSWHFVQHLGAAHCREAG